MKKNFDIQLLNKTLKKTRDNRWGLSVVYGLPVCETLQKIIENIQLGVEDTLPEKYMWYNQLQLHATLIRGKSSDSRLSPIKKHLLETIIHKIIKCPEISLRFTSAQLYSDGYIRMPCQSINLFPLISDEYLKEMEGEIGIKWRRTPNSWVSLGCLKNSGYDKLTIETIWKSTGFVISKFVFEKPLEIIVAKVKFIHFSNVTFMPNEDQRWIEIPLKSEPISNIDINQLGISLYNAI